MSILNYWCHSLILLQIFFLIIFNLLYIKYSGFWGPKRPLTMQEVRVSNDQRSSFLPKMFAQMILGTSTYIFSVWVQSKNRNYHICKRPCFLNTIQWILATTFFGMLCLHKSSINALCFSSKTLATKSSLF